MKLRQAIQAFWAIALTAVSCHRNQNADSRYTPTLHTDIAGLREKVDLPPGVGSARWVVRPRGKLSAAPGPTDVELFAYVAIPSSDWPTFESALGVPTGNEIVEVPEPVSKLIVDSTALVGLPRSGDGVRVTGPAYGIRDRTRMPYRGDVAVRLGDGLVICLWTE
jgi:hypothetical protein